MNRALCLVLLTAPALGCATPVATTAVAVGAAGRARVQGRCVAACTPGTRCNAHTGFCDPVPCAAGCAAGSTCVTSASGSRCEPGGTLTITKEPGSQEGAKP